MVGNGHFGIIGLPVFGHIATPKQQILEIEQGDFSGAI